MLWIYDPTAWMGLVTLVIMELILGIDNILFIAILAQKLPPHQRDRARRIGLGMALGMRVLLLCSLSWLAGLTVPLLYLGEQAFSGRDLILLVGGLFLLFKATMEIHSRLEGRGHKPGSSRYRAQFWMVVTQIIVLDLVFSLDAVVTAVGMTEHLAIMIIAVSIAIGLMIVTSKPLANFINAHPTLVILCLGFLLMVGFSLIAEGFGLHIPKGYLYAAIGFSILVESINQFAQLKMKRRVAEASDMRERAADTILRALGARKHDHEQTSYEIGTLLQMASKEDLLSPAEKDLLRGVLNLAGRAVNTIMTPRTDVEWLDISESGDGIRQQLAESNRSQLLVGEGNLDNILGVVDREDFLTPLLRENQMPVLSRIMKEPLFVHESVTILALLETFKRRIADIAVVMDEFGSLQGVITHHDLLEAIAGEFPDHDDPRPENDIREDSEGVYVINGMASIYDVRDRTGFDYVPDGTFVTFAGFILHEFARIPAQGEMLKWNGWVIEILALDGKRISTVRLARDVGL